MRNINEVFIHCSATMPHLDIGVEEIRRWHKARGWRDVGYHWVIRRDGTVEQGRSESQVGAHARLHNRHSIGVCLVGGISEDMEPEANYTDAQWESLETLVGDLMDRYELWSSHVRGHNEVSTKACPCFNVSDWVRNTLYWDSPEPEVEPEACPHCGVPMLNGKQEM